MRYPTAYLDEIRSRVAISSVLGRTLAWDRRKSNPAKGDFWACCPFHGEKTPSFHVDDRKGLYHCFGCKVSGDIFTFLLEKEGLSFPEAIERLAGEAGLPLPASSPEAEKREEIRASLFEVMEFATTYFQKKLYSDDGAHALAYLRRRGIRDETIAEFRLGYAPNSKSELRAHLADKGVSFEQMDAAGLVVTGPEIPVAYDRFRDRVMFPIEDMKKRVIAFGGRALSDQALAKYMNSPETALFDKGTVLYNVHRARQPAFEKNSIVLVEGYMDVIAIYQEGFKHAVAALGTALTENHLRQLWKFAADPVMCFDGDKAGFQAASRAFDRAMPLFAPGHSLGFTFLPDGKDPADLMLEGRKGEFVTRIENATPASDYFWDRETALAKIDTPEQKAALESRIKLSIGSIANPEVRRYYELKLRINLTDYFWKKDRSRLTRKIGKNVITIPQDAELEPALLGMAVEYPQIAIDDVQGFQSWSFKTELFNTFHTELIRLLVDLKELSATEIYKKIDPKFYFVLENVHGRENFEKKLVRGHVLFRRMPILKHAPSESFVIRLFDLLYQKIVFSALIEDRELALKECESDLTEESERILLALIKEIELVREQIRNAERELVDDAALISEAARASRAAKRSPIFSQIAA